MLKLTTDRHEASRGLSAELLVVIMPPPRRGGRALGGHRRLSSVCPSVCLSDVAYIGSNSKTKRPRKTKLYTGVYPRSHATLTPTSRSKGQKSRWGGAYSGGDLAAQLVCYACLINFFLSLHEMVLFTHCENHACLAPLSTRS